MTATLIPGIEKKIVIKHEDVTERTKIESKLKINEQNYRTLIENSQDLIFTTNINCVVTFSNKKFKDVLKFIEIEKINLRNIIIKELREDFRKNFLTILKGNAIKTVELIFVAKNGEKIFVEGSFIPLKKDDEVIGLQGFFKNITERKIAEDRLIKSQLRYKNLVENINDAIIIKNIYGNITYANRRFFELVGYDESELIGFKIDKYVYKIWVQRINTYYKDLLNNRLVPKSFDYLAKHANGKIKWFEDKPTLLYDSLKIVGTQIVIRDITEIKQKEDEFKKLIEDLKNKNNEMMQFNYIVSHNLRAPIANIIGLSNLLENTSINELEQNKIIKFIKNSSVKMDEIVKDLSLVLNSKTNLNIKTERFFIHNIIHSITETLEKQIKESSCIIIVEIDSSANELNTVKSYLESILYNLFSNGIKYRANKRQLIIKLRTKKNNDKLIIEIEDNGIGIDLKQHGSHIFGLYKRFNFDVDGKGLGLHMTKNQVEALGGKIYIESKPNKGTMFKIELKSNI